MLSRSFTGLRLSSYQEKRIRHMHATLDNYLAGPIVRRASRACPVRVLSWVK